MRGSQLTQFMLIKLQIINKTILQQATGKHFWSIAVLVVKLIKVLLFQMIAASTRLDHVINDFNNSMVPKCTFLELKSDCLKISYFYVFFIRYAQICIKIAFVVRL